MDKRKLILYAEDIRFNTYDHPCGELYHATFCYLHGKLQDENGFDMFAYETFDDCRYIQKNPNKVHEVTVLLKNGEKRECNYYYWLDAYNRQHGLVVLKDDEEANEYAKKKLEERSLIL